MKKQKPPAREPVQLHIDPTPAETTPEYTLEDIMNEFGGWTKREPEPAAAFPEPEPPKPEKPEETPTPETSETPEAAPQEAEAVRPAEPAPKEDKQPDLSAQTMRFAPVTAEPPKPAQPTIWTPRKLRTSAPASRRTSCANASARKSWSASARSRKSAAPEGGSSRSGRSPHRRRRIPSIVSPIRCVCGSCSAVC